MSYEKLATVYDHLMEDVPYDEWLRYVQIEKERFAINGNRILDVACGTGELSILYAKHQLDVTGVDLSSEMLMVARDKAETERVKIDLFQQDMSELEGLGQFDVITIFCDSLNYLETKEATQATFARVYDHLKDGGLFIFDVHSQYKVNHLYLQDSYNSVEDKVSYIWNSFPGLEEDSVEHELTFFVLDEPTGLYERFDELHKQRTYPIDQYTTWLEDAKFTIRSVSADFKLERPNEKSERIFFTCQKR